MAKAKKKAAPSIKLRAPMRHQMRRMLPHMPTLRYTLGYDPVTIRRLHIKDPIELGPDATTVEVYDGDIVVQQIILAGHDGVAHLVREAHGDYLLVAEDVLDEAVDLDAVIFAVA